MIVLRCSFMCYLILVSKGKMLFNDEALSFNLVVFTHLPLCTVITVRMVFVDILPTKEVQVVRMR